MWNRVSHSSVERDCRFPFSFYHQLIPEYWTSTEPDGEEGPFRWICTLARKMGVQSLLVEDALGRPDVSAEISGLERSPGSSGSGDCEAVTITYFSARKGKADKASTLPGEHVIAQATIVTFPSSQGRTSYVFEAMFRMPRHAGTKLPLLNNYVPLATDVEFRWLGRTHSTRGIYFCGQNGRTSLCAHSAVRMIMRAMQGQVPSTEHLAGLLGPVTAEGGIGLAKVQEAIRAFGLKPVQYTFKSKRARGAVDTPWGVLCSTIESGYPALLAVPAGDDVGHVLPVLGYTLNTDEWHPHASGLHGSSQPFISSAEWIDHVIVNDDSCGPYQCIARTCLQDGREGSAWKGLRPTAIVAILPEAADVTPSVAESVAFQFLKSNLERLDERVNEFASGSEWWRYLADRRHRLVLRTTWASKADYLGQFSARQGPRLPQEVSEAFGRHLPEALWVCEVSLPNLYAGNRAKLGEVLIRTSPKIRLGRGGIVGFRLPSIAGWRDNAGFWVAPSEWAAHSRLLGDVNEQEW